MASITWKLSELITKVRALTGRLNETSDTDDAITNLINEYYLNKFPFDVEADELRAWLTQTLLPTDSGEYSVAATVLKIEKPVTINGVEVEFYQDKDKFFEKYPKDTGSAYVINDAGAGLAIGTSSAAAVKNGNAFYYDISGDSYYKASAETALSGDTIPQNKYGAWRLEINSSGTISIVEADDNATGYATPGLAVQGLPVESSTKACMGYVTAMYTAAAGFIPGTTELSASGVTATYTDGFNSSRNIPNGVLLYGQKLYVRPKSNDWREIKAPYLKKPTALSGSAVPTNVLWGPIIAYGTAIEKLEAAKDYEAAESLRPKFRDYINLLNAKDYRQQKETRTPVPWY
jgi:hypothetical protein